MKKLLLLLILLSGCKTILYKKDKCGEYPKMEKVKSKKPITKLGG